MSFLAGLGSAIGSLVGSGSSSVLSSIIQDQFAQRDESRRLGYSMRMWNAENAYNTPSMQMERFRLAGLNPNLIYGQTNMASAMPSAPGSTVHTPDVDFWSAMAKKATVDNLQEQNKNLKEQNTKLQADSELTRTQTELQKSQKIFQDLKNAYFKNTGRLPREESIVARNMRDIGLLGFDLADVLSDIGGHKGALTPQSDFDKTLRDQGYQHYKTNTGYDVYYRR